jgi:hypothetical protein
MTITGQGEKHPIWGVSGFGLGPIPRFTDPSGHLRAVSGRLDHEPGAVQTFSAAWRVAGAVVIKA